MWCIYSIFPLTRFWLWCWKTYVTYVFNFLPQRSSLNIFKIFKYCASNKLNFLLKGVWEIVTTFGVSFLLSNIQGDPNQSLLIQMAITLKICISDPMLVKPKCVSEACIYFQFSAVCLQFSAVYLQFSEMNILGAQNTFWLYQHRSQKCIFSEL